MRTRHIIAAAVAAVALVLSVTAAAPASPVAAVRVPTIQLPPDVAQVLARLKTALGTVDDGLRVAAQGDAVAVAKLSERSKKLIAEAKAAGELTKKQAAQLARIKAATLALKQYNAALAAADAQYRAIPARASAAVESSPRLSAYERALEDAAAATLHATICDLMRDGLDAAGEEAAEGRNLTYDPYASARYTSYTEQLAAYFGVDEASIENYIQVGTLMSETLAEAEEVVEAFEGIITAPTWQLVVANVYYLRICVVAR
ncbi:MAG: hypothetical protein ABWX82_02780 [Leifsonia sp.]